MKAKPFQFSALESQIQNQFYGALLFGTDNARVQELSKKIQILLTKQNPDLEIIILNGNDLKSKPFLATDEANMPSLLAQRRLIILNDLNHFSVDALLDFCQHRQTNAFLLIQGDNLPKNNALRIEAESHINFLTIACYPPENAELEQIIRNYTKSAGFIIDPDAIQYLIENTGHNTLILQNELEKIILYNNQKLPLHLSDIQKLTGFGTVQVDTWIQLVINQKLADALHYFNLLLNQGEQPVSLLRSLNKYFSLLLQGRDLFDQGQTLPMITKKLLKPSQFRLEQPFQLQIKHWKKQQLISAQQQLMQAEIQLKSNLIPQDLVIKKVLYNLIESNVLK